MALRAYSGWNWFQRDRSGKASVLFETVDKAVQAGDVEKATRAFADMREHYASSAYTQQTGMLLARLQFEKGQNDAARASLEWVAANAVEKEYQQLAKIRLAGVLLDEKKYDEALKALPTEASTGHRCLGLRPAWRHPSGPRQRRTKPGRPSRPRWPAMDQTVDYRRLVDAKLTSLGEASSATPAAAPASASAATASAPAAAATPAASEAGAKP